MAFLVHRAAALPARKASKSAILSRARTRAQTPKIRIRRPVPYEGLRIEPREANVSHGERRRAPISAPSPEENPNHLEDSFP
jgi:hypothetical protein